MMNQQRKWSDVAWPSILLAFQLNWANHSLINGKLTHHPFDQPAGIARLASYLTDRDPEHFSQAVSTTANPVSFGDPGPDWERIRTQQTTSIPVPHRASSIP